MRLRNSFRLFGLLALMISLCCSNAYADKASVTLQVPDTVQKGSEVLLQVKVTHSGNNFMHYVEWVYVSVNGKEIARWNYTGFNRPEAESFTREVKYTATDNFEIKAEANCNLHGSTGPVTRTVVVKE